MEFRLISRSERIFGFVIKSALGIMVVFGLIRAFLGPPVITIYNASPYTLTNIKAVGDGFSRSVADLKPEEHYYFIAIPDGESHIALEFTANGIEHPSDGGGYFESGGGHCVTVTIDKSLKVGVATSGPLCFSWRRIVYPSDRSLF